MHATLSLLASSRRSLASACWTAGPSPCRPAPASEPRVAPTLSLFGGPPPAQAPTRARALALLSAGVCALSSHLDPPPHCFRATATSPGAKPLPSGLPLLRRGLRGAWGIPRIKGEGAPEPGPGRLCSEPPRLSPPIPAGIPVWGASRTPLPLFPAPLSLSPLPLAGPPLSLAPSSSPSPSLPPHNAVRGAADMAVES